MKALLVTILAFALAIYLGVCAGHMADRHFKAAPLKTQIELTE